MFVNHLLATSEDLPPITAPLYEYVTAESGVFKRARRDVMSATIPVCMGRIKGLKPVKPELITDFDRVPESIMIKILEVSAEAARQELEALFYLSLQSREWRLEIPRQIQRYDSVEPCEKGAGSPYERAVIEIHSHHRMPPRFSPEDDRDETGFRIYGVIGSLNPARDYWPAINLRLGVYGDWWPLQADRILEMPQRLRDHNSEEG